MAANFTNKNDTAKKHLKIAVIGSGIAGLSSSWLLSLHGHEVHIYEKEKRLGLGSHSIDVGSCGDVVDVPIRCFSEGFYSELLSLFRYVGIETSTLNLSPSIQVYGQSSYYKLYNFVFGGRAIPYVHPWELFNNINAYWTIFRDMFYFRKATFHMQKNKDVRVSLSKITLAKYLLDNKYSKEFTDKFLIPIFAVIASSSAQDARGYPVTVVMDFLSTMLMTGKTTRRMKAGTREASKTLAKDIKVKHTSIKVKRIEPVRDAAGKLRGLQVHTDGLPVEMFDHVIIATQANQALKLFSGDHYNMREKALKGFTYVWSEVAIHNDERLMPVDQSQWSASNVFVQPDCPETVNQFPSNHSTNQDSSINIDPCQDLRDLNKEGLGDCSPGGAIMCTMWQNVIQPLEMNGNLSGNGIRNVFQTWNPWIKPRPEKVYPNGYHYFERPVVTIETEDALQQLQKIQGDNNIWFIGAYSQGGVPLLENGADSGLTIAERITGQKRPWTRNNNKEIRHVVPDKMILMLIFVIAFILLSLTCFTLLLL